MEGPIQLGSTCLLRDLQAEPSWNGLAVQVLEFQMDQGRFLVQPADNGSPLPPSLAVRPQNLVPVQDAAIPPPTAIETILKPGTVCTLNGLKTAAFNGEVVMILKYIAEEQRYQVRPISPITQLPPLMAIKAENLQPERDGQGLTKQSSRRSLFSLFRKKSESKLKSDAKSVQSSQSSQRLPPEPTKQPTAAPPRVLPVGSVPNLVALAGDDEGSLTDSSPANEGDSIPPFQLQNPRMGGLLRGGSVPNLGSSQSPYATLSANRSYRDLGEQGSGVFSVTLQRSALKVGSMARLKGLQTQAALNGATVVIQEFVEEHGRYRVRMLDDDDDVTVNGRDMMIHRRNLQEILELDAKSETSSLGQVRNPIDIQPGQRFRLTGLRSRPTLNGHLVDVVEIVSDGKRFRVRPTNADPIDPSGIGVLCVFRENLIPDESPSNAELLESSARVVLSQVPNKPALQGELATVVEYLPEKKAYRLRLLGATAIDYHGGINELLVPPHCVKVAPFASMWVNMVIQGNSWRVPSVCDVEDGLIRVRLDTFAGIDRVVPIAKLLMGEDKCDWMNDDEVEAVLRESASGPLSCNVIAHRNEIMVNPTFQSRSPFFKAMMEYELLQATGMRSGTGERNSPAMDVFKVMFPLGDVNSRVTTEAMHDFAQDVAADDENPFHDGEDENPFGAAHGEDDDASLEQLSTPTSTLETETETEQDFPLYVSQTIEYDLVDDDEPLPRYPARCPSPTLTTLPAAPRAVRKPDPPGRQGQDEDSDDDDDASQSIRSRSRGRGRGRDPTSSRESSRERGSRARSKSRTKTKKKKSSSNKSRSKSCSRVALLYTTLAPLKAPAAHE